MFWRCFNRSRKTIANYGRTSKHSEFYALCPCRDQGNLERSRHQNILSTVLLKNVKLMEMSDFTWQHQKYARPGIYVATYVHNHFVIRHCSFILFYAQHNNDLVFKIQKIDCLPDPKYIANASCRVKAVSWTQSLADMDCDIVIPLRNITVNYTV